VLFSVPSHARRGIAPVSPSLSARLAEAPATPLHAWVYFDSKDTSPRAFARALAALTPRARARRMRGRASIIPIDPYDLPVRTKFVNEIRASGVHIRNGSRWLNAVSVEADAAGIERVARLSFVKGIDAVRFHTIPRVETQPLTETHDPTRGAPHAPTAFNYGPSGPQIRQINVDSLHESGLSGAGVLIAVLDAGFNNLEHVSLQHLDIQDTWDFVNGDANVDDQLGQAGSGLHGTLVLSAMAGFAPGHLIGPAYGASFLLYKTENTDWERHVEEDAWAAAAERADSIGADIISTSLGYRSGFTNGDSSYTWRDMDGNTTIVTRAADIAAGRGILVVASAGNSGTPFPGENTMNAPADGDSVLAVAAADLVGARVSFSSMGPTFDGRTKPDVAALGLSTVCAATTDSTSYRTASGTSLSCPLVAGAAALILEAHPSLTNMNVISRLRSTASRSSAPDNELGWGVIDAQSAAFPSATHVGHTPLPQTLVVHAPVPNPFNPTTTISYELPASAHVDLSIYDARGRVVTRLVHFQQSAGPHEAIWSGHDRTGRPVASGVYLFRLRAGHEQRAGKLTLIK